MSNDNNNAEKRTAATDAARKAARAEKRKQARPEKPPKVQAPRAIQAGSAVKAGRESNKPAEQFNYVFGPQDKALHDYLRCVFNPDKYSARVPNSRGGFELYTQLWKTSETGAAIAGPDGSAAVGVCCTGWIEAGNQDGVPTPECAILGYTTNGAAVIRSNNAGVNINERFPAVGSNFGAVGFGATPLITPVDSGLTNSSRIRLVACQLKIHSVMAAITSKGEVMLVGSVNPVGVVGGGALNNATWAELYATNDDVVTRSIRSLAAWKSGETSSIVAIPAEQQAFEMVQPGAIGYNGAASLTPYLHLGFIARSMTNGDTVNYEVTYIWESEMARTYAANDTSSVPVGIPSSTLNYAMNRARPLAHSSMPGIHSLPFVETLAMTNPAAASALVRHPAIQAVAEHQTRPSKGITYSPAPSFISNLGSLARTALKGIGSSALVGKIPYIGGAVQGIAGLLSSIFD